MWKRLLQKQSVFSQENHPSERENAVQSAWLWKDIYSLPYQGRSYQKGAWRFHVEVQVWGVHFTILLKKWIEEAPSHSSMMSNHLKWSSLKSSLESRLWTWLQGTICLLEWKNKSHFENTFSDMVTHLARRGIIVSGECISNAGPMWPYWINRLKMIVIWLD